MYIKVQFPPLSHILFLIDIEQRNPSENKNVILDLYSISYRTVGIAFYLEEV
jgi:hypothetical protein